MSEEALGQRLRPIIIRATPVITHAATAKVAIHLRRRGPLVFNVLPLCMLGESGRFAQLTDRVDGITMAPNRAG
jgi:hypothetical protein